MQKQSKPQWIVKILLPVSVAGATLLAAIIGPSVLAGHQVSLDPPPALADCDGIHPPPDWDGLCPYPTATPTPTPTGN